MYFDILLTVTTGKCYVVMYIGRHIQPYLHDDASKPEWVALCNTFHIAKTFNFIITTQTKLRSVTYTCEQLLTF